MSLYDPLKMPNIGPLPDPTEDLFGGQSMSTSLRRNPDLYAAPQNLLGNAMIQPSQEAANALKTAQAQAMANNELAAQARMSAQAQLDAYYTAKAKQEAAQAKAQAEADKKLEAERERKRKEQNGIIGAAPDGSFIVAPQAYELIYSKDWQNIVSNKQRDDMMEEWLDNWKKELTTNGVTDPVILRNELDEARRIISDDTKQYVKRMEDGESKLSDFTYYASAGTYNLLVPLAWTYQKIKYGLGISDTDGTKQSIYSNNYSEGFTPANMAKFSEYIAQNATSGGSHMKIANREYLKQKYSQENPEESVIKSFTNTVRSVANSNFYLVDVAGQSAPSIVAFGGIKSLADAGLTAVGKGVTNRLVSREALGSSLALAEKGAYNAGVKAVIGNPNRFVSMMGKWAQKEGVSKSKDMLSASIAGAFTTGFDAGTGAYTDVLNQSYSSIKSNYTKMYGEAAWNELSAKHGGDRDAIKMAAAESAFNRSFMRAAPLGFAMGYISPENAIMMGMRGQITKGLVGRVAMVGLGAASETIEEGFTQYAQNVGSAPYTGASKWEGVGEAAAYGGLLGGVMGGGAQVANVAVQHIIGDKFAPNGKTLLSAKNPFTIGDYVKDGQVNYDKFKTDLSGQMNDFNRSADKFGWTPEYTQQLQQEAYNLNIDNDLTWQKLTPSQADDLKAHMRVNYGINTNDYGSYRASDETKAWANNDLDALKEASAKSGFMSGDILHAYRVKNNVEMNMVPTENIEYYKALAKTVDEVAALPADLNTREREARASEIILKNVEGNEKITQAQRESMAFYTRNFMDAGSRRLTADEQAQKDALRKQYDESHGSDQRADASSVEGGEGEAGAKEGETSARAQSVGTTVEGGAGNDSAQGGGDHGVGQAPAEGGQANASAGGGAGSGGGAAGNEQNAQAKQPQAAGEAPADRGQAEGKGSSGAGGEAAQPAGGARPGAEANAGGGGSAGAAETERNADGGGQQAPAQSRRTPVEEKPAFVRRRREAEVERKIDPEAKALIDPILNKYGMTYGEFMALDRGALESIVNHEYRPAEAQKVIDQVDASRREVRSADWALDDVNDDGVDAKSNPGLIEPIKNSLGDVATADEIRSLRVAAESIYGYEARSDEEGLEMAAALVSDFAGVDPADLPYLLTARHKFASAAKKAEEKRAPKTDASEAEKAVAGKIPSKEKIAEQAKIIEKTASALREKGVFGAERVNARSKAKQPVVFYATAKYGAAAIPVYMRRSMDAAAESVVGKNVDDAAAELGYVLLSLDAAGIDVNAFLDSRIEDKAVLADVKSAFAALKQMSVDPSLPIHDSVDAALGTDVDARKGEFTQAAESARKANSYFASYRINFKRAKEAAAAYYGTPNVTEAMVDELVGKIAQKMAKYGERYAEASVHRVFDEAGRGKALTKEGASALAEAAFNAELEYGKINKDAKNKEVFKTEAGIGRSGGAAPTEPRKTPFDVADEIKARKAEEKAAKIAKQAKERIKSDERVEKWNPVAKYGYADMNNKPDGGKIETDEELEQLEPGQEGPFLSKKIELPTVAAFTNFIQEMASKADGGRNPSEVKRLSKEAARARADEGKLFDPKYQAETVVRISEITGVPANDVLTALENFYKTLIELEANGDKAVEGFDQLGSYKNAVLFSVNVGSLESYLLANSVGREKLASIRKQAKKFKFIKEEILAKGRNAAEFEGVGKDVERTVNEAENAETVNHLKTRAMSVKMAEEMDAGAKELDKLSRIVESEKSTPSERAGALTRGKELAARLKDRLAKLDTRREATRARREKSLEANKKRRATAKDKLNRFTNELNYEDSIVSSANANIDELTKRGKEFDENADKNLTEEEKIYSEARDRLAKELNRMGSKVEAKARDARLRSKETRAKKEIASVRENSEATLAKANQAADAAIAKSRSERATGQTRANVETMTDVNEVVSNTAMELSDVRAAYDKAKATLSEATRHVIDMYDDVTAKLDQAIARLKERQKEDPTETAEAAIADAEKLRKQAIKDRTATIKKLSADEYALNAETNALTHKIDSKARTRIRQIRRKMGIKDGQEARGAGEASGGSGSAEQGGTSKAARDAAERARVNAEPQSFTVAELISRGKNGRPGKPGDFTLNELAPENDATPRPTIILEVHGRSYRGKLYRYRQGNKRCIAFVVEGNAYGMKAVKDGKVGVDWIDFGPAVGSKTLSSLNALQGLKITVDPNWRRPPGGGSDGGGGGKTPPTKPNGPSAGSAKPAAKAAPEDLFGGNAKAKVKPEAKPTAGAKAKPATEAKPEAKPKAAEDLFGGEAKPKPVAKAKPVAEAKPATEAKATPEDKAKLAAGAKPGANAEPEVKTGPDAMAKSGPDVLHEQVEAHKEEAKTISDGLDKASKKLDAELKEAEEAAKGGDAEAKKKADELRETKENMPSTVEDVVAHQFAMMEDPNYIRAVGKALEYLYKSGKGVKAAVHKIIESLKKAGVVIVFGLKVGIAAAATTFGLHAADVNADNLSAARALAVDNIATEIVATNDNQARPFIIADKAGGTVTVFSANGVKQAQAPALFGKIEGDALKPGMTPSGKYSLKNAKDTTGKTVKVLYKDGQPVNNGPGVVSMHRVLTTNPAQARPDRLASPTPADNRVSLGCINVSDKFYNNHLEGTKVTYVYIAPDTQAGKTGVFSNVETPNEAAERVVNESLDNAKDATIDEPSETVKATAEDVAANEHANGEEPTVNPKSSTAPLQVEGTTASGQTAVTAPVVTNGVSTTTMSVPEGQATPAEQRADSTFDTQPIPSDVTTTDKTHNIYSIVKAVIKGLSVALSTGLPVRMVARRRKGGKRAETETETTAARREEESKAKEEPAKAEEGKAEEPAKAEPAKTEETEDLFGAEGEKAKEAHAEQTKTEPEGEKEKVLLGPQRGEEKSGKTERAPEEQDLFTAETDEEKSRNRGGGGGGGGGDDGGNHGPNRNTGGSNPAPEGNGPEGNGPNEAEASNPNDDLFGGMGKPDGYAADGSPFWNTSPSEKAEADRAAKAKQPRAKNGAGLPAAINGNEPRIREPDGYAADGSPFWIGDPYESETGEAGLPAVIENNAQSLIPASATVESRTKKKSPLNADDPWKGRPSNRLPPRMDAERRARWHAYLNYAQQTSKHGGNDAWVSMISGLESMDFAFERDLRDFSIEQAMSGNIGKGLMWKGGDIQEKRRGFFSAMFRHMAGATPLFDNLMTKLGIARAGYEMDSSIPSVALGQIRSKSNGAYAQIHKKFIAPITRMIDEMAMKAGMSTAEVEEAVGRYATLLHVLNEGFEGMRRSRAMLINSLKNNLDAMDNYLNATPEKTAAYYTVKQARDRLKHEIKTREDEMQKFVDMYLGFREWDKSIGMPGGYTRDMAQKALRELEAKYGGKLELKDGAKHVVSAIRQIRNFGAASGVYTNRDIAAFNAIGFKEYVPLYAERRDPFAVDESEAFTKMSEIDALLHDLPAREARSMSLTKDLSRYHREGSTEIAANAITNMKVFGINMAGRVGQQNWLNAVQGLYEGTVGKGHTVADLNSEDTLLKLNESFNSGEMPGLIRVSPGLERFAGIDATKMHPIRARGYNASGDLVTFNYYFTDPAVQEEIYRTSNLSASLSGRIMRDVGAVTRGFARLITTLKPMWNVWNWLRDGLERFSALMLRPTKDRNGQLVSNLKLTRSFVKNLAYLTTHPSKWREIYGYLTWGETSTPLQMILDEAVGQGAINLMTSQVERRSIMEDSELSTFARIGRRVGGATAALANKAKLGKLYKTPGAMFDFYLTAVAELPQITTALAAYMAFADANVNLTEAANRVRDQYDPLRANNAAITTLSRLFPFTRSVLSGNYNMWRTLTQYWEKDTWKRPVMYAALVGAASYLAITVMAPMFADDDDDDDDMPRIGKLGARALTSGLPLPFGEEGVRTIPSGFGINNVAWATGANIWLLTHGFIEPEEATLNVMGTVIDNTSPTQTASGATWGDNAAIGALLTVTPSILLPIAEIAVNKRSFDGGKIVKGDTKGDKYASDQGSFNTPEDYKAMAAALREVGIDVRPEIVQHVLTSYMAGPLSYYPKVKWQDKSDKTFGLDKTKGELFGPIATMMALDLYVQPKALASRRRAYAMQEFQDKLHKRYGVSKAHTDEEYESFGQRGPKGGLVKDSIQVTESMLKDKGADEADILFIIGGMEFKREFDKANREYIKLSQELMKQAKAGVDKPYMRMAAQRAFERQQKLTDDYVAKYEKLYYALKNGNRDDAPKPPRWVPSDQEIVNDVKRAQAGFNSDAINNLPTPNMF